MTTKHTQHLKDIHKAKTVPLFHERFGVKNAMAVPRIEKVVVNVGVGRVKDEKEREEIKKSLRLITGQNPDWRPARVAIASFKSRQGMLIGYRVTMRGQRMYDFLERFVWAAIPRMRDFRGIALSSVDEHGNMHVGIREHIIFPELIGEDIRRIFSLQVSIVTNAGTKERAEEFFKSLGFPLAKEEK